MSLKEKADSILYGSGLLEELNKYGIPHIVGSYRTDTMAWNDLDIDVENDNMSLEKLYDLSRYIIGKFNPTWYEAKEESTDIGQKRWFHGFEFVIDGELWNIDIWFFDRKTIDKAENFCDEIIGKLSLFPHKRGQIVRLKEELIARKIYSFDKYNSLDVYEAVLNRDISGIDDFIKYYGRK